MTLIGRLAAPPEVAVVANDRSLVRYAVGVNTGQQQTSWFRVSHFPPTDAARDFMAGLQKGQMVAVEADSKIQAYSVQEGEAAGQQRKTIQLRQRRFHAWMLLLSRQSGQRSRERGGGFCAYADSCHRKSGTLGRKTTTEGY